MSKLEELLGQTVLNNEDKDVPVNTLCGTDTVIGLYFSAHWCPPCKSFTPVLIKFYETMKSEGKKFEIVFISSDEDQKEFDSHRKEMPWLCLPLNQVKNMSTKFNVYGIPTVILIDGESCEIITEMGRTQIITDPNGKEFPWRNECS